MSIEPKRFRGAKNLEFGGGFGDRKTEFLMIGVLVLIIAAATVFTILRFTGDEQNASHQLEEFKYQCQKCKKVFTFDPGAQAELLTEEDVPLDCEKCGAKASCLRMIRCPNPQCGKYYVGEDAKFLAKIRRGVVDPTKQMPARKCPHCGTDWNEYWKQQYLKRKGK